MERHRGRRRWCGLQLGHADRRRPAIRAVSLRQSFVDREKAGKADPRQCDSKGHGHDQSSLATGTLFRSNAFEPLELDGRCLLPSHLRDSDAPSRNARGLPWSSSAASRGPEATLNRGTRQWAL
jgi:hypothetical protein